MEKRADFPRPDMTYFPFGTFMRLLRLARSGSQSAIVALLAFVAGLGLLIGSAVAGSGVGVVVGGVLFAVGFAGSRPPTWFG
jgi:hypothetical protein